MLMSTLEASIRRLTQPINGQFPRPWMTNMAHPENARIFVVGYNQATGFPAALIGSHDDYIDALFNRNDGSCRKLYEQLRGDDGPSPTRKNIDKLRENLARERLNDVVETNVICYSTPMSNDLTQKKNKGGKAAGAKIFKEILAIIRPKILIAHGARTAKEPGRVLSTQLPAAASNQAEDVSYARVHTHLEGEPYAPIVFVIPSLAPPAWNVWQKWAEVHLAETCAQARKFLDDGARPRGVEPRLV
jgi:hypothetical protein